MGAAGKSERARSKGETRRLCRAVEREIAGMAAYWGRRKMGWLDAASEEFDELVEPFTFHVMDVTPLEIQAVNRFFTEWVLFERPMCGDRTPLEIYIDRRPDGVPAEAFRRLRQVADTHLFSRFAILGKDTESDMVTLRDVRTGRCYEVCDPCICAQDRWSDGTIAMRIAQVDGLWQAVGQTHLYDVAKPELTAADGPGAVHPEDRGGELNTEAMSFYLRLLRDVIGISGRYTSTLRLRTASAA